jgi:hypothetical protein
VTSDRELNAFNSVPASFVGGGVATFSLAPGANEIALHEMGHTAFSFADEYEYYAGLRIRRDRPRPLRRRRALAAQRHQEHQSGDHQVGQSDCGSNSLADHG